MKSVTERVEHLLNPKSVAIVGASERAVWASSFINNIFRWEFRGPVYFINPNTPTVFGRQTYRSLVDVPDQIDHALIAVPAAATLSVLADCAAAGVRSVTAIASGFTEAGDAGRQLALEVARVCSEQGIDMIGPNCFGFINFAENLVLSRNWLEPPLRPGGVSLVFQSGQIGLSTCGSAYARGVDLRYAISSGNEIVLTSTDYFEYFLEDPQTKIFGGVLERIADPPRFARLAQRAMEIGKPIVLCKQGRSDVGMRVAAAHTASVAGVNEVVDTFLRDNGVITVDTIDEMVETCGLFVTNGLPAGGRTLFIGASGGAGGYFADAVDKSSIELTELGPKLRTELAAACGLPETAVQNPFDITASGAGGLPTVVELLTQSADYDAVVLQGDQPRTPEIQSEAYVRMTEVTMSTVAAANAAGTWTCFSTASDREPTQLGRDLARAHSVSYLHGQPGIRAMSNLIDYSTQLQARLRDVQVRGAHRTTVDRQEVKEMRGSRSALSEPEAKALLARYGIDSPTERLCHSRIEAINAAKAIGYPVVIKIASADILHKSDIGGVILDIRGESQVGDAYDTVVDAVAVHAPDAHIDGVLVCEQVVNAVELLLGLTADADLGQVVVVGAGGLYVEQFGDVAFGLPPFDSAKAERLLRSLRVWPVLNGARTGARCDIAALGRTIARFSQMVADLGSADVQTIEINPLAVRRDGRPPVALDAVVEFRTRNDGEVPMDAFK